MEIFPKLDQMALGSRFDVVCKAVVISNNGDHLFRTLEAPGSFLIVRGDLPNPVSNNVFLGLRLMKENSKIIGCIDEGSQIFPEKPCQLGDMYNIVELCCGMGAFSLMSSLVGFKPKAGVDHNDKWQQLWANGHTEQAKFHHGDIGSPKVVGQLLNDGNMHATILSGVSCQPYSSAGDGRGMEDERSDTLPKTLMTGWLLQSPIVIIECVPGVMQNEQFQKVLKEYCTRTGCYLTQSILHLGNMWSAKRDRWFGCITANVLGPIKLEDLPKMPQFTQIGKVMPAIRNWDSPEMEQLKLTLYELGKFDDYSKGGIEKSFLRIHEQLPTVLHSNGNQLYPCRCGCRPALSLKRLQERGLFCTLIPLPTLVQHNGRWRYEARYLHPKEVFLLNGGLPSFDFGKDLRLGLAAVGQCVSPLQSLWILCQIADHLGQFADTGRKDPNIHLQGYIDMLFQVRDEIWIPSSVDMSAPGEANGANESVDAHIDVMVGQEGCPPIQFRAGRDTTVDEFLQAESKFQGQEINSNDVTMLGQERVEGSKKLSQSSLHLGRVNDDIHHAVTCECPCTEWETTAMEVSPTVPYSVAASGIQVVNAHALRKVEKDGFLGLLSPRVSDQVGLDALVSQHIDRDSRMQILENQKSLWADDEIAYFLHRCLEPSANDQNVIVWPPLLLTSAINTGSVEAIRTLSQSLPAFATVISAVVIEGHWNPVMWRITSTEVLGFTCGLKHNFSMALQFLHSEICRTRAVEPTLFNNRQLGFVVDEFCGAMTISFIHHLLWGEPVPPTKEVLHQLHEVFRTDFISNLTSVVQRPWVWGQGQESSDAKLSALLQEHGVPLDAIVDRIQFLKAKLGASQIEQALCASQPWRELKWVANRSTPVVQLIKPSELQSALDKKVKAGIPLGNRSQKQKGKGKGKGAPTTIDPSKLRVETGLFVCGDKTPLSQVEVAQVGPMTSGIVLCSAATAAPYLKGSKQISAGGLGMIVLAEASVLPPTSLIVEKVRIPLLCTANSEPILADGYLYQLGAMPVTRQTSEQCFELVSINSCVIKVAVYRDQCEIQWSQFVSHPLKHIFSLLPVLRACEDPECAGGCEMWHVSAACSVRDPILELWGRQFMKLSFAHSSPEEAEQFTVHIRLPACVLQQVQTYSGINGLFVEPKAEDGRQPSPSFHVIWMPRMSLQDLTILRQTHEGICGLARMGSKMGVRCRVEDAVKLHQEIKPGSSFLPPGRKQAFMIGPVPFGTVKESITAMCASIGWTARAVQPMAGARHLEGLMWKVQALEAPKQLVIRATHGEVLITKMEDNQVPFVEPPKVVGSEQTVQLCSSSSRSNVDQIFVQDPWAAARKMMPAGDQMAKIQVSDPLAALERKVVESVLQQLPKHPKEMEIEDDHMTGDESRIQDLEKKVAELHDGQCQLHNMICEQGRSHGSQIQQLQNTTAETAHQVSQFQVQFSAQLEQQQGQLDSLFQQQMHKIEEILKRPRHHE